MIFISYAGEIFSRVMGSIEQLNAKYTVLYVSDPFGPIEYRSYRGLERFLAEGTFGNGSANSSTCDGVCQIKSSLLEGILVVSLLCFLSESVGYIIQYFTITIDCFYSGGCKGCYKGKGIL